MSKCPYCHAELERDVKKCRHCGEWVTTPTVAPPGSGVDELARTLNQALSPRARAIRGAIGLVVFAVLVILTLLWQRRAEQRFDEDVQRMHREHDERVREMRERHEEDVRQMRSLTP